MLAFVDESGDCGFGINSSKYLILAIVIFPNRKAAAKIDRLIANLKNQLGKNTEFKFSECRKVTMRRFFKTILPRNFEVQYIVIDKQKFIDNNQDIVNEIKEPRLIYAIGLFELLKSCNFKNAEIVLDNYPIEKSHLDGIKKTLNSLQANSIAKFIQRDSKTSNLIQLADMMVGAVNRWFYSNKKDNESWLEKLDIKKTCIIKIEKKLEKEAREFVAKYLLN